MFQVYLWKLRTWKIQGITWTLIRNVPTYGIFFAVNSYLADYFLTTMSHSAALLLAGGLTGIVSWTAAFPSDTLKQRNQRLDQDTRNWAVHWFLIKSRIQADSPENRKYPTSISVLSKTLKEDGHQVLWKGLGPCLLRSIPVCAILFTVQTMSSDFLRDFYSINKDKSD